MLTLTESAVQDPKLQEDGTTPPKPKRKKPGTAVKRKVQPIAVDPKGRRNLCLISPAVVEPSSDINCCAESSSDITSCGSKR